jgi:hypothetical protein
LRHLAHLALIAANESASARSFGHLQKTVEVLQPISRKAFDQRLFRTPTSDSASRDPHPLDNVGCREQRISITPPQWRQLSKHRRLSGPPTARAKRLGTLGKACLEALQGQGDAATARRAFKDAAEEAGILIGDAFRPSPKPKKRKR